VVGPSRRSGEFFARGDLAGSVIVGGSIAYALDCRTSRGREVGQRRSGVTEAAQRAELGRVIAIDATWISFRTSSG